MVDGRRLVAAAAWGVGSASAFALSSLAGKFLGVRLPAAELAWFRALAAGLFAILLFRAARDWRQAAAPGWHTIRVISGVLALVAFMYALTALPLALAPLILLTRVLMIPFAARLMLGEAIDARVLAAAVVGFAGALVALWPQVAIGGQALGAAAAVAAAVGTAVSQTAVRRLAQDNPPEVIVAVYGLACVVILLPFAAAQWMPPPTSVIGITALVALGVAGGIAQYAAAVAYKLAPAGFVAPFDFMGIPVAAALGFFAFGEVPGLFDLVGAALIMGSAWYVVATRRGTQ